MKRACLLVGQVAEADRWQLAGLIPAGHTSPSAAFCCAFRSTDTDDLRSSQLADQSSQPFPSFLLFSVVAFDVIGGEVRYRRQLCERAGEWLKRGSCGKGEPASADGWTGCLSSDCFPHQQVIIPTFVDFFLGCEM